MRRTLEPCPDSPNCVSSLEEDRSRWVAPFDCPDSGRATLRRLRQILASMSRVRIVETDDTYVRAEFTSLVLRFVDDLELLLDTDAGLIHVRSASRVGSWDLGANRRRVEDLRRRLGGR